MSSLSPIFVEETALSILLVLVLAVFAVMTGIFKYHWSRFGIPTRVFQNMTRAYFWISGTLAVLSVILFALVLFKF
ncbi:MAG TPA: hypothetical protein VJJ55_02755 [Candidatus Paceibacterota bacterium]